MTTIKTRPAPDPLFTPEQVRKMREQGVRVRGWVNEDGTWGWEEVRNAPKTGKEPKNENP